MDNKERILSVLKQVERRLNFMKREEFEKDMEDKKIQFCTFWTKQKVTVTIEIEEIE